MPSIFLIEEYDRPTNRVFMTIIPNNFLVALLVIAAGVSGCASTKATRWYLNGHSQAELDHTHTQCQIMASQSIDPNTSYTAGNYVGQGSASGSGGLVAAGLLMLLLKGDTVKSEYEACMSANGYTIAN